MLKFALFALIAIGALIVTFACVTSMKSGAKTDSQIAHEMVQQGATLLDVRTPEEYAQGHADGAINIPVQVLSERLSEIPKDRDVVVYCQSGRRSAKAADILTKAGYKVFDLKRFSDW